MPLSSIDIAYAVATDHYDRMPVGAIDFEDHELQHIAAQFAIPEPFRVLDFPEKGNINQHTFLVIAGEDGACREYLLQRINQLVFTRPRNVMAAMMASIAAQNSALKSGLCDDAEGWTIITLIPTRTGRPFLEHWDERGLTFWRLMERIPDCRTYKSLGEVTDHQQRLRIAEEAGRGLALYGRMTAGMDTSQLASPLPGYRDTRLYYDQLLSVLAGSRSIDDAGPFLPTDARLRQSTEQHFLIQAPYEENRWRADDPELAHTIALARESEALGTTLVRALKNGEIHTVAIHGDTKLDNFLFCDQCGRAKAVVDLDTIMPHTWLSDWGDMVRSLANVAGEKERDLSRVDVDMEVFEAVARGFLSAAGPLDPAETALMVEAVQVLTLELGVRFLADYLRGDSYFRLGPDDPADLNKVRAMVQFALFERLREREPEARAIIAGLLGSHSPG